MTSDLDEENGKAGGPVLDMEGALPAQLGLGDDHDRSSAKPDLQGKTTLLFNAFSAACSETTQPTHRAKRFTVSSGRQVREFKDSP